MRLAARVVALVAAACGSLAVAGMPPAAAFPAAAFAAAAFPAAASGAKVVLTQITPAVLRPGDSLVVEGTVEVGQTPAAAEGVAPVAIRLIRSRITLASRSDVDDWATGTGPAFGAEVSRQSLEPSTTPVTLPFRLKATPDEVRLARAFGVIPLAIEVLGPRSTSLAVTRTFVGWQRSADYTPLSLSWLLPITLAPDAALFANGDVARTAAWDKQLGPTSRLTTLLRATADRTVGYAVDPAVLGPWGRTPSQDAADPAAAPRLGFAQALSQAAARHPVFALPDADPDVAALTAPDLAPDVARGSADLFHDLVRRSDRLAESGVTVSGSLAWPADGALPGTREDALRAAYGNALDAVLVSAEVTDPTARLTPPTAGVAPRGTPVLRWDDRLGQILGRLRTRSDGVLAGQEFVAQTAALLAERPSIARTYLVVPPRGFDSALDVEVLAGFLAAAEQVPWLRTVGPDSALHPSGVLDATTPLPTLPPPTARPGADPWLARVTSQRALIATLAELLGPTSPTVTRLQDFPGQLVSTRWQDAAPDRDAVLQRLEASTSTLSNGVSIVAQTTNFLADEGVIQVTVVNALDEPVSGLRAVVAPGNGRLVVVEPAAPVDIAARAKATVSVRMAAVAQGLVPVNAWLTTANGTQVGATQKLTIRAAPPGPWLYIGMGGLFALVLVGGVVRAVRRPPRQVVDTQGLDPVDPTPEEPLAAPVHRHTAP